MRRTKTILGIILTLCYVIGLIAMIMRQVSLGLLLWVVSTLGGMGFLWYTREKEKPTQASPDEGEQPRDPR